MRAPDAIERAWRDGLTPDPLLTVSEWADRYRVLSQRASSEPGRWRTERTPYLREIMDCLSPSSPVQRVVFMKGAQIGGHRGRQWVDWLRDPPGAGADDGGGADGGAGQAQLQAADRSADRGERGPARAGQGAPLARQRQHGAQQGVPGRRADPDRRQQRGRAALDAGALPVPRRGRRLPRRRRGRGRSDPAGRAALGDLPAAQDPAGLDAEDQGPVADRAGVRAERPAPVLRALPALP